MEPELADMTASPASWKSRLDSVQAGLVAGVAGTVLGWGLLGLWWAVANDSTFEYFYRHVWIGSQLYRDSILTASVLLNVVLFYLANRWDMERFAQGLLGIILIAVPLIVYYQAKAGVL